MVLTFSEETAVDEIAGVPALPSPLANRVSYRGLARHTPNAMPSRAARRKAPPPPPPPLEGAA